MRKDISKVICERPRLNPSDEATRIDRRNWRQNPNDDITHVGMKKIHKLRHGYHSKELNENLKPLYRFLRSRCGKKWDAVYSEICANLNKNSAIQLHVFQHLEHMIEKDVQIINGKVCDSKGIELYRFRNSFYVDNSGILCELLKEPKHKYNRNAKTGTYLDTEIRFIRTDNELIDYCMINGVWYEITFKKMEKDVTCYVDILNKNKRKVRSLYLSYWSEREFNIYFGRIPIKKRQLNSKEIKQKVA